MPRNERMANRQQFELTVTIEGKPTIEVGLVFKEMADRDGEPRPDHGPWSDGWPLSDDRPPKPAMDTAWWAGELR